MDKLIEYFEDPPRLDLDGMANFNLADQVLVPEHAGIYFLHDFRGILYIGRTENLKRRFSQHLWRESNSLLRVAYRNPVGKTQFSWVMAGLAEQVVLEKDFIQRFRPPCNVRFNRQFLQMVRTSL